MPDEHSPVVLAGASGLIGRALTDALREDGIPVTHLVRRPARRDDEVEWLTDSAPLDPDVLAGARAVVGLNGASIGHFPWTPRYKSTLLWSRLTPTRTLADALAHLGDDAPPFVSASAVGYYGSTRPGEVREDAPAGTGFLADLCVEWEASALRAAPRTRVALLRTAPVVHPDGVLAPLMTLTKLGVSGPIGRGTQVWPWISLADEIAALRHAIDTDIDGPVNLSGPRRATANDLGFHLAVRMNRPYLVRAPAWGMKLALGPDATEALLTCDVHVVPDVLARTGFTFAHATVEDAIDAVVPLA